MIVALRFTLVVKNRSGIPTEQVLGPLLYSLYTSDLPGLLNNTQLCLYADDTAILYSHKVRSFLKGALQ